MNHHIEKLTTLLDATPTQLVNDTNKSQISIEREEAINGASDSSCSSTKKVN